MLLVQNIRHIFLKNPLSKASISAMSPLTSRQHSEPYSRIDSLIGAVRVVLILTTRALVVQFELHKCIIYQFSLQMVKLY